VSQAVIDLESAGDGPIESPKVTQVSQPKVKKLNQAHEALWNFFTLLNLVFQVLWVVGSFIGNRPYSVTALILTIIFLLLSFPRMNFFTTQTKAGISFLGTSLALLITSLHTFDISLLYILPIPVVWAVVLVALWVYVFITVHALFWKNHRKLAIIFGVILLYPAWGLLAALIGYFSPETKAFTLAHLDTSPKLLSDHLPWFLCPAIFFSVLVPLSAAILFFRYELKVLLHPNLTGRHYAGLFLGLGCILLFLCGFLEITFENKSFTALHTKVMEKIPVNTLFWRNSEVYAGNVGLSQAMSQDLARAFGQVKDDAPPKAALPAAAAPAGADAAVTASAGTVPPEGGAAPPTPAPAAPAASVSPAPVDSAAAPAQPQATPEAQAQPQATPEEELIERDLLEAPDQAQAAPQSQLVDQAPAEAQAPAQVAAQPPAQPQAPEAQAPETTPPAPSAGEGTAPASEPAPQASDPVSSSPEASTSESSPGALDAAAGAAALSAVAPSAAGSEMLASSQAPGAGTSAAAPEAAPATPAEAAPGATTQESVTPDAQKETGDNITVPNLEGIEIKMPHIQPGYSLGPDTTIYFDKDEAPSPFYFDDAKDPSVPPKPNTPIRTPDQGQMDSGSSGVAQGDAQSGAAVPAAATSAPAAAQTDTSAATKAPAGAQTDASASPPTGDTDAELEYYKTQNEAIHERLENLSNLNDSLSQQLSQTQVELTRTQDMYQSLLTRVTDLEEKSRQQGAGGN
jgi:hypothetical protein